MNSSQQPPEFIKDPEETDDEAYAQQPTWEGLFGSAPDINLLGEPTLWESLRDAWDRSKANMTPEKKRVYDEFWQDMKDPKTYVEYAVMITALGLLKRKRGWGKGKTILAFLVVNEAWAYIEDPARGKRAYRAAFQRG